MSPQTSQCHPRAPLHQDQRKINGGRAGNSGLSPLGEGGAALSALNNNRELWRQRGPGALGVWA